MADVVQYRMERMVDELEDLEKRGLFTHLEISEIVKKRRDFEYRIKRRSPFKQDYIDYIEYEKQVDRLRNLRKREIIRKLKKVRMEEEEEEGVEEDGRKKKKGGKLWKRSVSDSAGVIRILDVYKKATVRYKDDLNIWFKYLEFCREHRHGAMKQALIQALRFNSRVPGLWLYGSAWEFNENLNVSAARALMQSGLRVCSDSEDMWVEYLRMELTYLNKLKARKVALGEDVHTLVRSDGNNKEEMQRWKENNKDLFMPIDEEKDDADELDTLNVSLVKKEDYIWEQGANILRTVFQGATEALPSNMSLRKRFLEILDEINIAHSDELREEVFEDLRMNFGKDEGYWDWLAKYQICRGELKNDSSQENAICKLEEAIKIYEDALERLPSTKMFFLYSKFLLDIIGSHRDSIILHETEATETVSLKFSSLLLNVYKRAECSGYLNGELALQYVSLHIQLGNLEEAKKLAIKFCDGSLLQTSNLWGLRISIEMRLLSNQSSSLSTDDFNSLFQLFQSALAKSCLPETESLWLMALKIFSTRKKHFKKLVEDFIIALLKSSCHKSSCFISCAILDQVVQSDGIDKARVLYKRFLALPRPHLAFFKHCIDLETKLSFVGDKNGLANARKMYESALTIYMHDRELWKDYCKLETEAGTSQSVSAVVWRARKTLDDTTGFEY